jgi:hypothetical protein
MGVSFSPDELEEDEELDPDPVCVICPGAIEKLMNSVALATVAIRDDRERNIKFGAKEVRISLNTICIRHPPESKRPRTPIASRCIACCFGFGRCGHIVTKSILRNCQITPWLGCRARHATPKDSDAALRSG